MYTWLKHISFITLLSLLAVPAIAQESCTYSLSGKVIDEHDGQPLPFATVYIEELEVGTVSDIDGNYRIGGLCAGTYTIMCSHVGCEPVTATIKLTGNTTHNFFPEHHTELLEEATIIGTKIESESTLDQHSLTEKDMDETKGQSLGTSLKKITGVTTLSSGNNVEKPVIHGMHSNRVLILNNGVRQEGQQWGNEHAPEIDPFIADELTVVKGASSVRYGPDAIAGVVMVSPKELSYEPGIKGALNLVGFSNGRQGVVSGIVDGNFARLPSFSWRLQGTYKQGGNIRSPDYYLKNTGIKEYNFSWAAGYEKQNLGIEMFYSQFNTDIGIFSASHIGNLTDLEKAFEADEPLETADFTHKIDRPWQQIEHELFKAKGYILTGNSGKLSITYARQYNKRLEYDKDLPLNDSLAALNLPALQFEITTHTGDLTWEHNWYRSLKGSFGVSIIDQGNTYAGRYFIPNFKKYGGGIFWIERWKPLDSKIEIEAGIRYDHIFQEIFMWQDDVIISPEHTYDNVSGSIGGIYKFSKSLLVKINAGTAWRPPNVNEMYSNGLHHGAAAVEIGDTSLVAEQAYNISAAVEYTGDKLSFTVDAYYNYINDFIYLKPVQPPTLTIRGAFPTFRFSQVDATLNGFDVTVHYRLPLNLNITSKASILRAYNQSAGEYLVLMPADRFENTLEYKFSENDRFSDAYVSLTLLSVLEQTRVPENSDYVPPPAGYNLLGIQAGFSVPIGHQKMKIGIGVDNLLNSSYRDYMNRFRYFADEMGTNLSLRITVPFAISGQKSSNE